MSRRRAAGRCGAHAGPFDLDLAPGACLAVTGPSGAGKSLLLRMLADLDPHEGEAWLDGAARSAMPAPDWRRRVASLAAEPGWWEDRVGAHFATAPAALLAALGLPPAILDRPVALCSTGERQRLALARTLSGDPAALLLDEPTGALDAASVAAMEAVLRARPQDGAAVVLVTPDPARAARLGTQHVRIAARGDAGLTRTDTACGLVQMIKAQNTKGDSKLMKSVLAVSASTILLVGCVSVTSPVLAGKDTYMIGLGARGGLSSDAELLAQTIQSAGAFCTNQHRTIEIVSTSSNGMQGWTPQSNQVLFKCVLPS